MKNDATILRWATAVAVAEREFEGRKHMAGTLRRRRAAVFSETADLAAGSPVRAGRRALEQQRSLRLVAGQLGRAPELLARLVEPAQLLEQVAAHGREQVVALQLAPAG